MNRLWWVASLLVAATLLVGGCNKAVLNPQPAPISEVLPAEHPKGMKSLRWLTDAEKAKVIEIALNTPESLKQLDKGSHYETRLSWIAIVWDSSEYNYSEYWGLDYEWVDEKVLPPPPNNPPPGIRISTVPESAEFYSRVVINFGEPPQWQISVAINPDTGKVALVEENPFRTGPTPTR